MKSWHWAIGVFIFITAGLFLAGPYFLPKIFAPKVAEVEVDVPMATVEVELPEPTILFGYVVDSLDIVTEKVRRNQSLSTMLTKYNVSHELIYDISQASKNVFDVRKVKPNRSITYLLQRDSVKSLEAFIYEPSETEYVVFNIRDSVFVNVYEKEIINVEKTATGVIYSSLAETMGELDLSPLLTNEFADIFAWQIDFFHLYPGDKFKVIYEEQQVDGKTIGIGDIKGAYFEHAGNDYFAVRYDQGNGPDFFDEDGASLRKALLRYPVKFSRISSRYSGRRFHPVQKRYKAHRGTDFAAPKNTPIRSVGDGIVMEARYHKFNGNYVKVKHNGNYTTGYLHMNKIASGMRPGVKVKQGQIIGYVGNTGLANGNHVCFRFWKNGVQVDALKVQLPPSEPITTDNQLDYEIARDEMMNRLSGLDYPKSEVAMATTGD